MLSGSRRTSTATPTMEFAEAIGESTTREWASRASQASSSARSVTPNDRWSSPTARLVEGFAARVGVLGEAQPGVQAVVAKEHLAKRPIRRLVLAHPFEPEHLHIPVRARLHVANGEAEVMDADHGGPIVRAAGRPTLPRFR